MRYLKTGSDEFLQNGGSTVRVGRVLVFPSPVTNGRVVRVFEVLQIVRKGRQDNPLPRGALLALSFPSDKVNADDYEWYRHGWEECFIPYTVNDPRVRAHD
jgi:hypothetical protein